MLLYYLRHGDPIYDPSSLTEYGHAQAKALSKRMVYSKLDYLFVSPSGRAVQTAVPTAAALNLPLVKKDWLNEDLAWGEFSCPIDDKGGRVWIYQVPTFNKLLNSDEIRNMGFSWYDHPAFANTKCKEGCARIRNEMTRFMASFGLIYNAEEHTYTADGTFKDFADKRIGVFAHEGIGALFLSALLDIPYPYLTRFDMTTTGMSVIRLDADGDGVVIPRLLQYDNDSHLYKEGLSTDNKGVEV
ncbi:MAG: histidine phosphatase family protein [Oscillospiraceae bacterium]|nr:histidine phosphatase family protein [Candidatus Equicaccousia limihippi]